MNELGERHYVEVEGWKGAQELVALLVPIAEVTEDPANVRTHDALNLSTIANSLREFGQTQPVIVRPTGVLIAGEGRLRAMRDVLGWTQVARVVFTGSEAEATHLALMDNRSGELGAWDYEGLGRDLADLHDAGENLVEMGWKDIDYLTTPWAADDITEMPDNPNGIPVKVGAAARRLFDQVWKRMCEDQHVPEGAALEMLSREWMVRR